MVITRGELIEGWQECWKWWSTRFLAVMVAAPELYEQVPSMREYIPQPWFHHIMGVLALLTIVSRITKQSKGNKP